LHINKIKFFDGLWQDNFSAKTAGGGLKGKAVNPNWFDRKYI